MEVDESDLTWKSEKDIIKDLAFLNDFGSPGDTEPYKVLYSIGRGTKIKDKQRNEDAFLDSRTGEVIDLKDVELDTNGSLKKGHGRGKLLGNFSSTNFQLQEQLRLARPLGSGDEAFESYFKRKKSCEYSTSTSDSDPDSQSGNIASKSSSCATNSDKHRPRIIGSRNSLLQSNVLISNLLSKAKGNCNTESTSKTQNKFTGEDEIRVKNYNDGNNCNSDGAYCKNDEPSLREPAKLGGDELRDINSDSFGNVSCDLNQKCKLSTQANSDKGIVTSNVSDVPYFIKSVADFPVLEPCKRVKF